jgi:hypothetical protein
VNWTTKRFELHNETFDPLTFGFEHDNVFSGSLCTCGSSLLDTPITSSGFDHGSFEATINDNNKIAGGVEEERACISY